MGNKRFLLLGLVVILAITLIKLGTNLIKDNMALKDDDITIISSDEYNIEVVEDEGMRRTVFYFRNKDGYLVPVMKRIPWEDGIARTTIKNMIDSEALRESLIDTGLEPLIPMGTEILGMSINPDTGLCKIDFSSEIRNVASEKDEENLIKGVVYTLTEFPTISEVQIMIEGNIIPVLKDSVAINKPITRENINLLGKVDDGSSKVVVFFKGGEEESDYFIPVTIPTLAPMANVYTALDLLFDGPPEDAGLKSELPNGIDLQGVEIKEGTAFVDIKLDDKAVLDDDMVVNDLIKNIGLTLSQFDEIDTVELLLEGTIVNTSIPVFANEY